MNVNSSVGRRIRSRSAPDRRPVDLDHLADEADALDAVARQARRLTGVRASDFRVMSFERRLARSAHAGDGRQDAMESRVDVLQVVRARP
jgi:hypothetical protein